MSNPDEVSGVEAVQAFVETVVRSVFPSMGLTPVGIITASWSLHATVVFKILAELHGIKNPNDREMALASFRESVQDSIVKLQAIASSKSREELEATMRLVGHSVSNSDETGWQETGSDKVRG